MSELRVVLLPCLGGGAKIVFEDARPHHYMFMRIFAPEHTERKFYLACRAITEQLQVAAAKATGKEHNGLFPEERSYDDWEGHFLWEFWWHEPEWDVDKLWAAFEPWFTERVIAYMAMYE